jgi:hypothetical protein
MKFFGFRICIVLNFIQVYLEFKFQGTYKGKGKAIPILAWRGPDSSRRLRFPDLKTIGI